jgi:glycosyltransferase involved in cell wall biosynthesis
MQVKVSVVMCTYNGAKYIKEQIDTILAQTYPLFEFLIFDDSSTDDTMQILVENAATNPVIKVIKNEVNVGFAANFKKALLAAKGDVIAIADQDDVWAKQKIERMLSDWNETSLLVYCNSIRFTNIVPSNPLPNKNYRRFEGANPRKIFLFNTISGHAMLIKRELLEFSLPYADNIFYDWWFAVNAAYNGGVSYVDEILVYQRVHTNNVSVGGGFDYTKKRNISTYKKMVLDHLGEFQKAHNLPVEDKVFIERFAKLLKESLKKRFSLSLFLFLIKHSSDLFFYKKRKVKLFSNVKHAYRLS